MTEKEQQHLDGRTSSHKCGLLEIGYGEKSGPATARGDSKEGNRKIWRAGLEESKEGLPKKDK